MKSRSERLMPAVDHARQKTETALQKLGEQKNQLAQAEHQLAELQRYRQEYAMGQQSGGMSVHALLNRQQFIERIDQAITQQTREVARRQRLLEQAGSSWREANARERVLDGVVERAVEVERRSEERREQNDVDERMQHRRERAI
ncbi:flagellar export protein FliJ [Dyella sp. A6]|uniref:flagellar export protein FliJ n=1 Tax=Dyella aluminiiresistens TaxID=3069105 RepID=UPI002E77898C|nr:flagellar export protein FliJ [Dyella sp. A6]